MRSMRPKPATRGAVEHRKGEQEWNAELNGKIQEVIVEVGRRLETKWAVHWPDKGEYFFVIEISGQANEEAKGLAIAISKVLPGLWIVFGRLFVKDGWFYRRRFGYRMEIVHAKDVHVVRHVRGALRGLI